MSSSQGKILATYHKQYPVLSDECILPIHVGREAGHTTKDGNLSDDETKWLIDNMIGDNTGDNISNRNREFSECTGLYWFWKNYDYSNLDFVGAFQYRRQLILNDIFDKAPEDREKRVYKCLHLRKENDICKIAGINAERIIELLSDHDYILPYRTSLEAAGICSVREDYLKLVPGVHIADLFILEDVFSSVHPKWSGKMEEYLSSPNKLMYQVFITKPQQFISYCEWLFDLLFRIDLLIDTSLYSTNGKRTMGYLAEILYGFYFTYMVPQDKVLNVGVTYLE